MLSESLQRDAQAILIYFLGGHTMRAREFTTELLQPLERKFIAQEILKAAHFIDPDVTCCPHCECLCARCVACGEDGKRPTADGDAAVPAVDAVSRPTP